MNVSVKKLSKREHKNKNKTKMTKRLGNARKNIYGRVQRRAGNPYSIDFFKRMHACMAQARSTRASRRRALDENHVTVLKRKV